MVYLTGRAALPGDVAFEEALAGMEDKWYVGPDLLIEWLSHELPHEYSLIVCAFPVYFVYRMWDSQILTFASCSRYTMDERVSEVALRAPPPL